MRKKVLNETGERVYALIFDIGEDPMAGRCRRRCGPRWK